MKEISYPYAYGHLSGALHGYKLMQYMKERGLDLQDWDLERSIENLLDDAIHQLKQEVQKAAEEHYEKYHPSVEHLNK